MVIEKLQASRQAKHSMEDEAKAVPLRRYGTLSTAFRCELAERYLKPLKQQHNTTQECMQFGRRKKQNISCKVTPASCEARTPNPNKMKKLIKAP